VSKATMRYRKVVELCFMSFTALLRLRATWWHIGEVAASQMFGRGSNFQIRTAFQAGLLPLSCQYAR